jgi:hypothetical protein
MYPEIVDQYVAAVDAAAPGLLTGLYLTGSIALDDYQPGVSDVDAVATVSRSLTPADLDALRRVHEVVLPDAPHVDVVYLTSAVFASQPSAGEVAPHSFEHGFRAAEQCSQLGPVTWAEVANYALTIRGEHPTSLGVTSDTASLIAWVRGNLLSYWAGHTEQTRAMIVDLDADMPLPFVSMLQWHVLGPPRLHYTVVTGEIASKTAAGAWAAVRFPEYAELIDRCLRSRRGEMISATVRDVRAACDLADVVTATALDRPNLGIS